MDSYAILAFFRHEAGWEWVRDALRLAQGGGLELHISAINMAEVQYCSLRRGRRGDDVLAALPSLPLHVASADEYIPQVVELKAKYPISLADCFAAALAIDLDCRLVTGDPEFRNLEGILNVEWLHA
jgi:ribonuclease VapC